jgi:hypothetical protein
MTKTVTCYRCNVPMVRQPEALDLSWAGDGPNAADVDFQGILVEVYHCRTCRGIATRPAAVSMSSRRLDFAPGI